MSNLEQTAFTKPIHDTIWIKDSTTQYLMNDLHSFYSDNFSHLLTIAGVTIGVLSLFLGVILPWFLNSRTRDKEKEYELKLIKYDKDFETMNANLIEVENKYSELSGYINNNYKEIREISGGSKKELIKMSDIMKHQIKTEYNNSISKLDEYAKSLYKEISEIYGRIAVDSIDSCKFEGALIYACKSLELLQKAGIEIRERDLYVLNNNKSTCFNGIVDGRNNSYYDMTIQILYNVFNTSNNVLVKQMVNEIVKDIKKVEHIHM